MTETTKQTPMSDTRWHPIGRLIAKLREASPKHYGFAASYEWQRRRMLDVAAELEVALKVLAEGQAEAAVSEAHATPDKENL